MNKFIKKIKSIYNEYLEEGKEYYKILEDFFLDYKNIWPKIKQSLKNPENRKKYITAVLILIALNIFFISQLFSYGYYYDAAEFPIMHRKIGNSFLNNYDYVLLVYLQNSDNDYHLVDEIPSSNYKYSGYKCNKGSVLIFDEDTRETSIDLLEKDVCSIYFDYSNTLDLELKIMLEDNVGSKNYVLGDNIPAFGYVYDHYNCENNSVLTYDNNLHKFSLSAQSKDKCKVYFNKMIADVTVRLFIENIANTGNYIESATIPSNNNYSLNIEKSYCKSNTGEREDANLTYTDGYINLDVDEITECSIYLNKNE